MTVDTRSEILAQEKRFWDAMQRKDGSAAAQMTADASIVVGAQGVAAMDKKTMERLTVEGPWSLESYEIDDSSLQIEPLGNDAVAIAYKVTERIRLDGKPMTLVANDSTVWRRNGGTWEVVMHTESVEGDPFGRDEK